MFTNLLTVIQAFAVVRRSRFFLFFFPFFSSPPPPPLPLSFSVVCRSCILAGLEDIFWLLWFNRPGRNGRDHYCLLGTGRGRGGGGGGYLWITHRPCAPGVDPQRPKRPSATTRTVWSNSAVASVPQLGSFVGQRPLCRTVTRNQLLEPEATEQGNLSQLLAKLNYYKDEPGPAKTVHADMTRHDLLVLHYSKTEEET